MLEESRKRLEDQLLVAEALERKTAETMEKWDEYFAESIEREIEDKKRFGEWKKHHELSLREFDDKLSGLIAWLADFVRQNPRNGK